MLIKKKFSNDKLVIPGLIVGCVAIGVAIVAFNFYSNHNNLMKISTQETLLKNEFETKKGKKITFSFNQRTRDYGLSGIENRTAVIFIDKSAPSAEFLKRELPKLINTNVIFAEENEGYALKSNIDCFTANKGFKSIGDIKIKPTTLIFDKSGKLEGRMNGYTEISLSQLKQGDNK